MERRWGAAEGDGGREAERWRCVSREDAWMFIDSRPTSRRQNPERSSWSSAGFITTAEERQRQIAVESSLVPLENKVWSKVCSLLLLLNTFAVTSVSLYGNRLPEGN